MEVVTAYTNLQDCIKGSNKMATEYKWDVSVDPTRMKTNTAFSGSITEITKALIAFQKICPKITKTKSGIFGMYADLAAILELIRPALIECGLAVVQMPDGKNGLTTIVSHTSGQWISGYYEMEPLPVIVDKTTKERAVTPQSIGQIVTYQRRYALGAALGFAAEEDTDARMKREKAAEGKPKKTAAELLKQAMETNNQSPTTETLTPDPSPIRMGEGSKDIVSDSPSEVGLMAQRLDGPCSAEDVATIKKMVGEWESIKPGVAAEFAKRMAATGRKLAQFSVKEADALKVAIQSKAIESFFDKSLQPTS